MIDDIERRLVEFLATSTSAADQLSQLRGCSISRADVEHALVDLFEAAESINLLNRDWTTAEIVDTLGTYDFSRLHPEVLEEIELLEDIIPDGIVRRVVEEVIRQDNSVWMMH